MKAIRGCLVVGCLSIILISCSSQNDLGDSGYITMMPYVNETMGFRGVVPVNWQETSEGQFSPAGRQASQTQLILAGFPEMRLAEIEALAVSELGIDELPSESKKYTSPSLPWDLYKFTSETLAVQEVQVSLALAEGENASYGVVMLEIMDDDTANALLYETIFIHAVHGLIPTQ
jgi:hypothetical protein